MTILKRFLLMVASGVAMDRDASAAFTSEPTRGQRVVHSVSRFLFDTRTELWEFASAFFALGLGTWLCLYRVVPSSGLHVHIDKALAPLVALGLSPELVAGVFCLSIGANGLSSLIIDKLDWYRGLASVFLGVLWTSVWWAVGPLGDMKHPTVPIFGIAALLSWHTAARLWLAHKRAHMIATTSLTDPSTVALTEGFSGTGGSDRATT